MKSIILVSLACFVLQSQYVSAEVSGMKKEDWLKRFKPIEVQGQCTDSPLKRKLSGSYQECFLVVAKLFDKCTNEVDNFKIPDVLTSRQEAEKYGSVMGECITAYYFGGEHLSLFNQAQDKPKQTGIYDPLPFFEPPKRINGAKPLYPKTALIHGLCGVVDIAFSISANGEVTDKKIIYSDPSGIFDSEVEKVINSWQFEKKFNNEIAIPYQTVVKQKFILGPEDCQSNPSFKQDALTRAP